MFDSVSFMCYSLTVFILAQLRAGLHCGGDHDFKVGLEFTQEQYSRTIVSRGANGDYTLRMQNGVPYQIDTLNSPTAGLNNMDGVFAYFKDSWRIGDRLTLNLGVRMDRYHSYLPAQTKERTAATAGEILQ